MRGRWLGSNPIACWASDRSKAGSRVRGRGDDGAALVEFAVVALLLFTLLFGIMEFGWSFYQMNDVRQGAREGARLAAVNYKTSNVSGSTQTAQIVGEICDRIEEGNVELVISSSGTGIGDSVTVEVLRKYEPLTGFFAAVFNPNSLDSSVEMRLEQVATFADEPDETGDPALAFKDCP